MKPKFYFHMAYINLCRRRKEIMSHVIIITLALITLASTLTLNASLGFFIDRQVLNTIRCRTLFVTYEKSDFETEKNLFEILNKDENVVTSYIKIWGTGTNIINTDELFEDSSKEAFLFFNASDIEIMSTVVAGEGFDENTKNVGIIPKQFYPDRSYEIGYFKEPDDFLDGEDFIGKTITVEFYATDWTIHPFKDIRPFKYAFEVVGVYDISQNLNEGCDVYIPPNDLQYIVEKIENESIYIDTDGYENLGKSIAFIVDDKSNINKVENKIMRETGLMSRRLSSIGPIGDIVKYILIVGSIVSIIVLIIGLINISLSTLKAVKKRTGEIGLLKAIGYTNKNIMMILSLEAFVTGLISLASTTAILAPLLILLNWLIQTQMSLYMKALILTIESQTIILLVLMAILLPLVTSLVGIRYALKIQPTAAITNN
ncbi:ABC transporter permease [Clostridium formicaceticum]|uniref:FtsX-like permease family protein n=1 Tax=Clostridium formicaceticum TaxID=1497 RepID=A0AAC9RM08_9CLOT|nr:ABC transporter permease [Clostridium formicaceticum]AOY77585.1 hypothetical protein BJL90_18020 [Clostridium formicaceticum]ARE88164.1 FtsX-like permease family protein [Clostridium formicaceticum]